MSIQIDKSQGYVLMWRSVFNSPIWTNPKLERIYHWVMYHANWQEAQVFPTTEKVSLNPGQFITSYPHAKSELKMSIGTINTYLKLLQTESIIEIKSTNKYTVITVVNWDALQNPERKNESRLKTERKQTETDNTLNTLNTERDSLDEEEKDSKTENHLAYLLFIPSRKLSEFSNKYSASQEQVKSKAEDLYNYCKAKDKTYSNYRAFLSNALKRDFGLRSSLSTFPERPGFVDAKTLKYH